VPQGFSAPLIGTTKNKAGMSATIFALSINA
jgi:hypothetical protein